MPRIRIFLCTYRRPHLLRRALASLLAQTFTDWVCELHNDDPADDAPRAILAELAPGDSRFNYFAHSKNWGAVATFNHVYAGGPEPYASLLEDDNWWAPDFLSTALRTIEEHPAASLVWANMRLWQEQPDGSWLDTGHTIWTTRPASPRIRIFPEPELYQAFDALHSQGAMVFRPRHFNSSPIPSALPVAIIESARERAATGPLILITTPLAHFARTLTTARSQDPALWLQSKLLVAASFFQTVTVSPAALARLWVQCRAQRPRNTDTLFRLGITLGPPRLLRYARPGDWIHFILSSVRHPVRFVRVLRFRRSHPETWAWFVAQSGAHTRAKTAQASLFTKEVAAA